MAKKTTKTLADMKREEIDEQVSKPLWRVEYKNYTFVAYKNSFYGERDILSCYLFRDDKLIEHSGRTRYFTQEKALEELKWKYDAYLELEVVKLLKEKAYRKITPPDYMFEPTINIELSYEDITPEQWEKVKEYFGL